MTCLCVLLPLLYSTKKFHCLTPPGVQSLSRDSCRTTVLDLFWNWSSILMCIQEEKESTSFAGTDLKLEHQQWWC